MDLWWKMAGSVRLRLTSADCAGQLGRITERGIRLEDIRYHSELCAEFTACAFDLRRIRGLLRPEDSLRELSRDGMVNRFKSWLKYPIILATILIVILGTLWLPGRIWFIRVQGNGDIPADRIIQEAAQCGVRFGTRRRELRSEVLKNKLLHAIPELGWAGVNTNGCVATITVTARPPEEEEESERMPGSIVAAYDALVTQITVTSGTGQCQTGQTVSAGQVLISGYSDLGICTRIVRAEGEVYGITSRRIRAVLPETVCLSRETGDTVEKYSLLIGKKRINFYSDSGILQGSCGKMREVRWLTLPGGWELPIALVIERCSLTECVSVDRTNAEALLAKTAERILWDDMIAGEILLRSVRTEQSDGLWILEGEYQCREMIGRLRHGVYLEGDTKDDRENGERGAG